MNISLNSRKSSPNLAWNLNVFSMNNFVFPQENKKGKRKGIGKSNNDKHVVITVMVLEITIMTITIPGIVA